MSNFGPSSMQHNLSMSSNARHADVIVIGGGVSGLVAASEVKHYDPGIEVLVLEASDAVGGRLCSPKENNHKDLGGEFVLLDESQKNVMQLVDQLGIGTEKMKRPEAGDKWIFLGSRASRPVTLNTGVPSFSMTQLLASLEMRHLLWRMHTLSQGVKNIQVSEGINVCNPYGGASVWRHTAASLDATTVKMYLNKHCHFSRNADAVELFVRSHMGRESSQISLLYLLTYLKSAGGVYKILGAEKNQSETVYVKGGAATICQRLQTQLGMDNVLTNQPVSSISEYNDRIYIETKTNASFTCSRIICAVPPSSVNRIDFSPPLPPIVSDAFANFSMGAAIKFTLAYERPHWREEGAEGGFSGETVCLRDGGDAPFLYLFDSTSGDQYDTSKEFTLTGTVAGNRALELSGADLDTFEHSVLETLTSLYGSWATRLKRRIQIKDWTADPWTNGGPSATPRPGSMAHFYAIREPCGRIHFASAEAATKWIGNISGAIQAGQCAAIEAVDELRPQALSAQDYSLLRASRLTAEEKEEANSATKKVTRPPSYSRYGKAVYRWTFVLPVCGLLAGYMAVTLRDRYAYLFVPMHT